MVVYGEITMHFWLKARNFGGFLKRTLSVIDISYQLILKVMS